jgi:outer membrane protein assembly factor BamB
MLRIACVVLVSAVGCWGAVGFRGDGSGCYPDAKTSGAPLGTNRIVWQVKLPSWSNNSPVPAGDRLFVGAEPLSLVCLAANDGAELWRAGLDYEETLPDNEKQQLAAERQKEDAFNALRKGAIDRLSEIARQVQSGASKEAFAAQAVKAIEVEQAITNLEAKWEATPLAERFRMPPTHGGTGYTTPSAVTDGQSVWALGGNGVAACFALDGKRKWIRLVEKPTQGHGHATSPVLAGGRLILAINNVHGLDPATGQTAWTTNSGARFGTPVVTTVGGETVVVTANGEVIRASDGLKLASKLGGLQFNSPIVRESVVYFVNEGDAAAVRLVGGSPFQTEPVWKVRMPGGRAYASPVLRDGLLYAINGDGLLTVLNAADGQKVLETKFALPGAVYTSPASVGPWIVAGSEGGVVLAIEAGREGREAGRVKLDGLRSSPAVAGDRLYLRTMAGVTCIRLAD